MVDKDSNSFDNDLIIGITRIVLPTLRTGEEGQEQLAEEDDFVSHSCGESDSGHETSNGDTLKGR